MATCTAASPAAARKRCNPASPATCTSRATTATTRRAERGTSPLTSGPGRRARRVRRRRGPGGAVRPLARDAHRAAGHGPRRHAARAARGRDAAQDVAHAARGHRPGDPHRARRSGRAVAGRDRPRGRARPGRARGHLAERGRDGLHARRRDRLAGPPLRARRQQRDRGRDRDPGRPPRARRRRARAGPVLGRPGRRRQRRRGDRAGDDALPGPRAVRRSAVLPDRAQLGGAARLARVDRHGARRDHLHRPHPAGSAPARASPSSCAAGTSRWWRPPISATRTRAPS